MKGDTIGEWTRSDLGDVFCSEKGVGWGKMPRLLVRAKTGLKRKFDRKSSLAYSITC